MRMYSRERLDDTIVRLMQAASRTPRTAELRTAMAHSKEAWITICAMHIEVNSPELSMEECSTYAEGLWINASRLGPVQAALVFEKIYRASRQRQPASGE
jgi:hypothetical protein